MSTTKTANELLDEMLIPIRPYIPNVETRRGRLFVKAEYNLRLAIRALAKELAEAKGALIAADKMQNEQLNQWRARLGIPDHIVASSDVVDEMVMEMLRYYMTSVSESAYCAGWMSDLEYDLWTCCLENSKEYGCKNDVDIDRLKKLRAICGGWWIWSDCETFVTLDEWLQIYAAHSTKE